uniref:Uncharacterized protein n=1 Tax=Panagrolaimus superbus TaxID=310955 RepID=A0A914Y242_9BILA
MASNGHYEILGCAIPENYGMRLSLEFNNVCFNGQSHQVAYPKPNSFQFFILINENESNGMKLNVKNIRRLNSTMPGGRRNNAPPMHRPEHHHRRQQQNPLIDSLSNSNSTEDVLHNFLLTYPRMPRPQHHHRRFRKHSMDISDQKENSFW